MYQTINIDQWSRKDHFRFFSSFEEPFFGIAVRVDCKKAKMICKDKGNSFFLYYLHAALRAANALENFRYRIKDGQVVLFDKIHASPTIMRPDGTFGFSYMDFFENFEEFQLHAKKEVTRVQQNSGLEFALSGENVIHFSALPWLDFSSVSHARSYSYPDSCPKISFGKVVEEGSRLTMAVSIHAHHGLVDGFHISQWVELFQGFLDGG